jgi:hypothetical protein
MEGFILKDTINRTANYIMKDGLPKCLEYLGGMPITRNKDIKKNSREELKDALNKKNAIYSTAFNLVEKGEIFVTHVQGTRNYKKDVIITKGNIKNLVKEQKDRSLEVIYCPLEIEYEDKAKHHSTIIVSAKEPINIKPNEGNKLLKYLSENNKYFSRK